ncbi:MAG: hypothetical protein RBS78_07210 [Coriobacteriia bacterium]|jgi:hypothetical protein|nr:hypothetical protein [Coriobacteriia bacterium]
MKSSYAASIAAAYLLIIATLSGCGPSVSEPAVTPVMPPVVDAPGLYGTSSGSVRAVGVLGRLEGGDLWGVFGVADSENAESYLITIVGNADVFSADLATYEGRYVEVRGALADQSGEADTVPIIEATAIEPLIEEGPSDPIP